MTLTVDGDVSVGIAPGRIVHLVIVLGVGVVLHLVAIVVEPRHASVENVPLISGMVDALEICVSIRTSLKSACAAYLLVRSLPAEGALVSLAGTALELVPTICCD